MNFIDLLSTISILQIFLLIIGIILIVHEIMKPYKGAFGSSGLALCLFSVITIAENMIDAILLIVSITTIIAILTIILKKRHAHLSKTIDK